MGRESPIADDSTEMRRLLSSLAWLSARHIINRHDDKTNYQPQDCPMQGDLHQQSKKAKEYKTPVVHLQ